MIFSKSNLDVVAVASREPNDRGLHGVRFEADGTTVAGNGRMFMAVEPVNAEIAAKLAPALAVDPDQVGVVGDGGLLLSLDVVERAIRLMTKGSAILRHAALTQVGNRMGFTSIDAKGDPTTNAGIPRNDGYPDWRGVFRKVRGTGDGGGRVCVSRHDLIQLLGAMEAACPDRSGFTPLFIEVSEDGHGIILRAVNVETGQRVVGAVATLETKGQWLVRNAWERILFGVRAVAKRLT